MVTIIYKDNDRTEQYKESTVKFAGSFALIETVDPDSGTTVLTVIQLDYIKQIILA